MYKVQIVHLTGSTFVELCAINNREIAEKEAEELCKDTKEHGDSVLWVGLWEGNEVIDTYDGQSWGREHRDF